MTDHKPTGITATPAVSEVIIPSVDGLYDPDGVPTATLLASYQAILDELRRRGVVRTGNAPASGYAEYLVARLLDGQLPANSEKSWHVAANGRRIQVKCRVVRILATRGSTSFRRSGRSTSTTWSSSSSATITRYAAPSHFPPRQSSVAPSTGDTSRAMCSMRMTSCSMMPKRPT